MVIVNKKECVVNTLLIQMILKMFFLNVQMLILEIQIVKNLKEIQMEVMNVKNVNMDIL